MKATLSHQIYHAMTLILIETQIGFVWCVLAKSFINLDCIFHLLTTNVNLEIGSTLRTYVNHQCISEAITDHVMTLITHRNTISVCLMCSGQIIYKPSFSGYCHHNQFSTYLCLNKYIIISGKPSLWLFLTISVRSPRAWW